MSDKLKEPISRFGRIADLADSDKPREKALTQGISSLSNAELLAIILGSGIPGKSVIQLSQEMLAHCKNKLQKLARLSIDDLTKNFEGVGPAKAISLIAAFELGLRHNDEEIADDPVITSSENVFHIMRSRLGRISHEEFWVLMLSRNNRVIYEQRISIGGTSSTMADAKIIYKSAIDKMAEAIILVHNHPSGNINPSPEDDRLTAKIKEAGKVLDIQVLDHVIITQNKYFSYADNGRL